MSVKDLTKYVIYQGKRYRLLQAWVDTRGQRTMFRVEGLDFVLNDVDYELGFEYGI